MNDQCTVKHVILQENGIIRSEDGAIIGRLNKGDGDATRAMNTLRNLFLVDLDYSYSWHSNIAMMCHDAIMQADITDENCTDEIHKVANDAASRFMKLCFDVETNAEMLDA